MKRYSGNAGSIGTASHMERHYPEYKKTDKTRRSRKKCVHYCNDTKQCRRLKITCVGPSNELCGGYQESKKKSELGVERLVKSEQYGVGMIMEQHGNRFFEVRYQKDNVVKKYSLREIKEMLLK